MSLADTARAAADAVDELDRVSVGRLQALADAMLVSRRDAYAFGQTWGTPGQRVLGGYANAGGTPLYPVNALGAVIKNLLSRGLLRDPEAVRAIARAAFKAIGAYPDDVALRRSDLVDLIASAVRSGAAQQLVVALNERFA